MALEGMNPLKVDITALIVWAFLVMEEHHGADIVKG